MQRLLVTNNAIVGGREASVVMAPQAMRRGVCMAVGKIDGIPPAAMGPRFCFVVTPNTIVLPVAHHTAFTVPLCLKSVAQRPPGVPMVPRHHGIMAIDAIVLLVAGIAGLSAAARFIDIEISRCAVILHPIPRVRLRPRERYLFLRALGRPLIGLAVHRRFRLLPPGRTGQHQDRQHGADRQDNPGAVQPCSSLKNHSASRL